jgi:hypothetical protein
MTPTVGRIVHYALAAWDVESILGHRSVLAMAAVGNMPTVGEICPAVVVRVFDGGSINLQVQLDGNDTLWATSRTECANAHESTVPAPGHWMWPPRQ